MTISRIVLFIFSALYFQIRADSKAVYSDISSVYRQSNRQTDLQKIILYDDYNQTGLSTPEILDYSSDLGKYSFDNMASSALVNGVWILYETYKFVPDLDPYAAVIYVWGENFRVNFDGYFNNKASSLKYVGASDGYKYDTITFFEGEYFTGNEQYTYWSLPQLNYDNFGASAIITGCSSWTIFEYDNYEGRSTCLVSANPIDCTPTFFTTTTMIGDLAQSISSVQKGCNENAAFKIMQTKRIYTDTGVIHQDQGKGMMFRKFSANRTDSTLPNQL